MLLDIERPRYRPSIRNAHKRKTAENPLFKSDFDLDCCGGRTQTQSVIILSRLIHYGAVRILQSSCIFVIVTATFVGLSHHAHRQQ